MIWWNSLESADRVLIVLGIIIIAAIAPFLFWPPI
jgi:hypothetical protein